MKEFIVHIVIIGVVLVLAIIWGPTLRNIYWEWRLNGPYDLAVVIGVTLIILIFAVYEFLYIGRVVRERDGKLK